MKTSLTSVLFLGSFLHYSALVLEGLLQDDRIDVAGVITTPPQPKGRKKKLQKNPVHLLAEEWGVAVATPAKATQETLAAFRESLQLTSPPDILLTAGYGKLLPESWLSYPQLAALNLHFSLLPAYRGANPAEWALLRNEQKTGISVIEMSPTFDTGSVLRKDELDIIDSDTRETIYEKLYSLGGNVLPNFLTDYADSSGKIQAEVQPKESPTPYAKRFLRDDGFIDWQVIVKLMETSQVELEAEKENLGSLLFEAFTSIEGKTTLSASDVARAARALKGYPGLWTKIPTKDGQKRMKLLSIQVSETKAMMLDQVQIAGQEPALWNQVKNILSSS